MSAMLPIASPERTSIDASNVPGGEIPPASAYIDNRSVPGASNSYSNNLLTIHVRTSLVSGLKGLVSPKLLQSKERGVPFTCHFSLIE